MTDHAVRRRSGRRPLLGSRDLETIERTVAAAPERVWKLWTTGDGISRWWAPDGFRTDVTALELRHGGELRYTMTAVGPDQIAFTEQVGMPLATESRKTFTEIREPSRLAYRSLIDFVSGHEPYEHLTVVDLEPVKLAALVAQE
jgi:uncharacterized protein YndB with AHSA1/START domain